MERNRNPNRSSKKVLPVAMLAAGVVIGALGSNVIKDEERPAVVTVSQSDRYLEQLVSSGADTSELKSAVSEMIPLYLDDSGTRMDSIRSNFRDRNSITSESGEIFNFGTRVHSDGSTEEIVSSTQGRGEDKVVYEVSVLRNADGSVSEFRANRVSTGPTKTMDGADVYYSDASLAAVERQTTESSLFMMEDSVVASAAYNDGPRSEVAFFTDYGFRDNRSSFSPQEQTRNIMNRQDWANEFMERARTAEPVSN